MSNDVSSDRLVRLAVEFLQRQGRQVMEVSAARQTPGRTPSDSAVRAAVLPTPPTSSSPVPSSVEASSDTRDGYCPRCKFRRINSVCSNTRCKGCCFLEGQWACSVHKKDGPPRPDSPSAMTAPGTPTAGPIGAGGGAAQRPVVQQAAPGVIPCAFCNRPQSVHGMQLAIHIQQCRPTFFEQYPHARKLNVTGLHQFSWSVARSGQAPPPIMLSSAVPGASSAPGGHVAAVTRFEPIRPGTAGHAPSDIARAMAWEQSIKDMPAEIERILPMPLQRPARTSARERRITDDEFERFSAEAIAADRSKADERCDAAMQRYRRTVGNVVQLFDPARPPSEPHEERSTKQLLAYCRAALLYRRQRERESLLAMRAEHDAVMARTSDLGDKSYALLYNLRLVMTPIQLKGIAGKFTEQHWLGWRARMPSHVQRRTRPPSGHVGDGMVLGKMRPRAA